MSIQKFKARRFHLWTYDVWGNAREGFDVNNRCSHGDVRIRCKRQVFNAGTPHEFETFDPTDRQLSRASGSIGVQWEGSDGCYYAKLSRNGRPVGKLIDQEES